MKSEKLGRLEFAIAQELADIENESRCSQLLNQIAAYELGEGKRPGIDDFLTWRYTADMRHGYPETDEAAVRPRARRTSDKSAERLVIEQKSRTALETPPNPSARKDSPFRAVEWETPATRKARKDGADG
ncbi:MAG: hypothetical protein V4614_01510 [Pseudomonadota bacterium]